MPDEEKDGKKSDPLVKLEKDSEGNPITKDDPKTTDPPKTEEKTGEKSFNQAEVDKIVQERLARDKAKNTVDSEQADKAKRWEEYEASQKTDKEKAESEKGTAEAETETLKAQLLEERQHNAFLAEAQRKGVVDPDLAWAVADRKLIVDKDGKLNAGLAVAEVLEERPLLKGRPSGSGNGSAGSGGGDGEKMVLTVDQKKMANALGQTEKDYFDSMTPEEKQKAREEVGS